MFTYIWKKYLPVIKILIKRSAAQDQILDLNQLDFERAGSGRKTGYKFNVEIINGKLTLNASSNAEPASSFVNTLFEDETVKALLTENSYEFILNTKFQLHIKNYNTQQQASSKAKAKEKSLHV